MAWVKKWAANTTALADDIHFWKCSVLYFRTCLSSLLGFSLWLSCISGLKSTTFRIPSLQVSAEFRRDLQNPAVWEKYLVWITICIAFPEMGFIYLVLRCDHPSFHIVIWDVLIPVRSLVTQPTLQPPSSSPECVICMMNLCSSQLSQSLTWGVQGLADSFWNLTL